MKQAVYFAGACAGIVLWHLPTTAACFARTVEGSYTCTEGGAVPAPMHSGRLEATSVPKVATVPAVPAVFGVEAAGESPSSPNDDGSVFAGAFAGPFQFAAPEPLVEPR